MKKLFLFVLLSVNCISLMAQKDSPKWFEKARKAVFTIETYDNSGNIRKGNGFFIQGTGEAVSDYTLFDGAQKAFVIDTEGRKMPVTQIMGADELYDVIRFKVAVPKNVPFLSIASKMPVTGAEAYLLSYGVEKNNMINKGSVLEVTKIKDVYGYYKVDISLPALQVSVPLLTSEGEVFAMAQADASGKNKTYGVSVPYVQSIRIDSKDLLNKTYASIGIRKAWADTPEEAQVALFFYASQQDASMYLETLNDFIATFPNVSDGYLSRASHYAYRRKELATSEAEQMRMLTLALADMNTAMKYTSKIDEGNYNQAKLMYGVIVDDSTVQSKDWNMKIASEKLQLAIAREDLPVYRQLEGDIAFYQGDFEKAYESYMLVNESPLASSLSFYLAAKTKQLIPGVNLSDVIMLMDSAVEKSRVTPSETLAYLQESIDLKMQFGLYDAAVADYNQYYSLLAGNVTDAFYYYREQAKFRSGDLEGALKDIELAISMDSKNAVYYAEQASVYLRMQEPVKAQGSVEKALALDADFAASHRLLGVCLVRQKKKDEGCKAFNKAKELGDPIVEKLIKENCQ